MHKPTERVLRIIEKTLASEKGVRLSEYSKELEIPKGTLFPILSELCERGYLKKNNDVFFVGTELYALSSMLYGSFSPRSFIREELRSLSVKFKETCYFGVLDGGNVHYLDKADSPNPLRMLTSVGQRLPAYATGVGKALLLNLSESEIRNLYSEGLKPLTPNTITDIDRLTEELKCARDVGYVTEIEESTEYIRCVGVPVMKDKKCIGALSVAIPVFRYNEDLLNMYVSLLKASASRISSMIKKTGTEI